MANEENIEMEMEQEAEHNKKESKCKGILIDIKTHEEDMQQMEDKGSQFNFFFKW